MIEKVKTAIGSYFLLPVFKSRGHLTLSLGSRNPRTKTHLSSDRPTLKNSDLNSQIMSTGSIFDVVFGHVGISAPSKITINVLNKNKDYRYLSG